MKDKPEEGPQYRIVITKIETRTVKKRGAHEIIEERPWTKEEFSDETMYQGPDAFLKSNPLKRVYGYAPSWQGVETEETELLKQTVDELDVQAVIRAVNNIK